jgi:hypothetical protein
MQFIFEVKELWTIVDGFETILPDSTTAELHGRSGISKQQ